ncbi:MAG: transcription antitermination factor NusB [Candidatus Binatus sp.]|uniref:transcription antitermination factor NusB n=1 Tax=Candidatus Binatus sp. TaxID=2811406 RepID=UPI0027281AE4|nr:transcription antitermination factor NusB [Candidatus Binatus sp.]MDO8430947.1 transcription antitermination factor NusB [Candidatus Binatus sp.]
MGLRHLGRELALKALYRVDICGGASNDDLVLFFETFPAEDSARRFAVQLLEGVRREQDVLDKHLAGALEHWSIKRLSRVDHNVLRMALYELLFMPDIPARVTMDEAIELAKQYGDIESGRFVNGVLDEIAGRLGLRQKLDDRIASTPE